MCMRFCSLASRLCFYQRDMELFLSSYFFVSDRDISRVLSFNTVKHNGEIGRLDLRSSGLVKVAINAVTLALCYFDISVAVFCVYSVWVICFVLVPPRIAVWCVRHSGLFCAREWCANKELSKPPSRSCVAHYKHNKLNKLNYSHFRCYHSHVSCVNDGVHQPPHGRPREVGPVCMDTSCREDCHPLGFANARLWHS